LLSQAEQTVLANMPRMERRGERAPFWLYGLRAGDEQAVTRRDAHLVICGIYKHVFGPGTHFAIDAMMKKNDNKCRTEERTLHEAVEHYTPEEFDEALARKKTS